MMDVADFRLRLAIIYELKASGVKPGRLSKTELRVSLDMRTKQDASLFSL
jgi:hypothetical protein